MAVSFAFLTRFASFLSRLASFLADFSSFDFLLFFALDEGASSATAAGEESFKVAGGSFSFFSDR